MRKQEIKKNLNYFYLRINILGKAIRIGLVWITMDAILIKQY
jgi:hypothetical protein